MQAEWSIPVSPAKAGVEALHLPLLASKGLSAAMLRLDKIHPVISGNKWFKLRFHFAAARQLKQHALITFGGAFSNHIVSTACSAQQEGFACAGIIRGERPPVLSHTLQQAEAYGMKLFFTDRKNYALKEASEQIRHLIEAHPGHYLIPEGGSGEAGIRGCGQILSLAGDPVFTHVICCIGTGTMFCGIATSLQPGQQLIGIPVLKLPPGAPLLQTLNRFCELHHRQAHILTGFEGGGYARQNRPLFSLMNQFYEATGIPTDFVYTAKLVKAFIELTEANYFPSGSRVLLVHSGGLQGNASLPPGTICF